MTSQAWNRIAAAAGIAWFVLIFVSLGISRGSQGGAPRTEIADFLADVDPVSFYISAVLELVALLLLVVFAAQLRERLARAGERGVSEPLAAVAFGAVLLYAAAFAVRLGLLDGVVRRADEGLDATTAAALFDAAKALAWVAMTSIALFLAATAVVVLTTRAMPRWLGWSAAVLAAALVPSLPLYPTDFPQVPGSLFSVWVVAAAVLMWRSQEPGRAPQTTAVT